MFPRAQRKLQVLTRLQETLTSAADLKRRGPEQVYRWQVLPGS